MCTVKEVPAWESSWEHPEVLHWDTLYPILFYTSTCVAKHKFQFSHNFTYIQNL